MMNALANVDGRTTVWYTATYMHCQRWVDPEMAKAPANIAGAILFGT